MKDFLTLFDEYTLKARFLPACLAGIPLLTLIASYFDWNKFLVSNIIVGLLIGFVMIFILSNFSRYLGRKVEKKFINQWGVLPTTQLLRHSDTTFSKTHKQKIHEILSSKSPIVLPSEQEEKNDPQIADEIYYQVTVWLKEQTRDEKILLNENITYGFVRNSLGLKPIAFLVCLIVLVILAILFTINYEYSYNDYDNLIIFIKKIKMALWLTFMSSILMPLYWIFIINKTNLRKTAINYARTLLELSYKM
ncbi:hypothetical protein ABKPCSM17A_02309 [Acinetobacter baumannii]|uniref:hypothetical protein n=1 Tax=Acinetobacter baumannii TaxID=470 RepID=UPI00135FFF60|nr:hypothetical protein [Acinetobacter baumannii]MDC4608109.1 hypothetical protein [Acinetobacter baumannii]MDC5352848.1 hypothetical protein [Acinetobacter baumannii]CAA0235195.1 hypothetical protein ABKPCSM17A_02309 [Acinetobacter baumannii]